MATSPVADQGDREGDCMKGTLSALAIAALVIWNAPIDHGIERRRDGRALPDAFQGRNGH